MARRKTTRVEFGDFQTPDALAAAATEAVASRGRQPLAIVEPTCGLGTFLFAALTRFDSCREAFGLEINSEYFRRAHARLLKAKPRQDVDLRRADFFSFDWPSLFERLPEPILVIGNPPWVTASELGALQSRNLPRKSNFQGHRGLDAVTGKSNFDIAEWMVIHLMRWLSKRQATIAMLLKTTVARKVLLHAWRAGLPLADAAMYFIDAKKHFGVGVEACLLVCDLRPGRAVAKCDVYNLGTSDLRERTVAFRDGLVLADADAYDRHSNLLQDSDVEPRYRWRSGVKHDCAKVMELRRSDVGFLNGFDEVVDLEPDHVYPMLKGSGVANGGAAVGRRYMIVTQHETGQSTDLIKATAPKTWAYLCRHGDTLDRRASSIYRNRPRFSMFGVGPYTFMPWKVAICGLYKRLEFCVIAPYQGKPVVLDDTVYQLSCETETEARLLVDLLTSEQATDFLGAFIFWDAKRPITVEILRRLDILALAQEMGKWGDLVAIRPAITRSQQSHQLPAQRLF